MKKRHHIATEKKSFNEILEGLPDKIRWAETVMTRLKHIATIPKQARVLDIGAASGEFLVACSQFGYQCEGIEPWQEARLNAIKLSEHLGIKIHISDGTAELLPFDNDTFDVVHACSVIEHVLDIEKAFAEIARVLKPGGIFWFNAASSMCPIQAEIKGFPLFGWYPNSVKRAIMNWVKVARPHLIGYTTMPAINWFTPWKTVSLLQRHGFNNIYDRWDLRGENEGGKVFNLALKVIRSTKLTKTLADIIIPECSYAAIKKYSENTSKN